MSRYTAEFFRIRMFFEVAHIEGSGTNENPRLVIAMETSPILRVARGLADEEIRSYAEKKSARYLPRYGFSRSISHYASGGST